MKMKRIIFIILVVLTTQLHGQDIIAIADSLRKANQIPEIAFAVITKDSILETAYLGYHKINSPDTASSTDRFPIGSNTKAMTGFIAAKLVETKKIKWDTRFFDLYPEWKAKADTGYWKITLQDLLSHRARIQPFTNDKEYDKLPQFTGNKQERRKVFGKAILSLVPVTRDENSKYGYSNADYTLASLMLERVTGKTWEELVHKTFNKDLGIYVDFGWPYIKNSKQTWGHYEKDGKIIAGADYDINLFPIEPAGYINITLPEYIKFIQLNLEGLSGKSNYLNARTYQFLHNGIPDYSIGWANNYYKKEPINFSTHRGSGGTYFCDVMIDQKKDIAFIIMINSGTNAARQVLDDLLRIMIKKYEKYGS